MMPFKQSDFFISVLGGVTAVITSNKVENVITPLIFAFVGGAISWLGKTLIKWIFISVKEKIISKNKKDE